MWARIQVLVAPLRKQLPDNVPGKALLDSPRAWASATMWQTEMEFTAKLVAGKLLQVSHMCGKDLFNLTAQGMHEQEEGIKSRAGAQIQALQYGTQVS